MGLLAALDYMVRYEKLYSQLKPVVTYTRCATRKGLTVTHLKPIFLVAYLMKVMTVSNKRCDQTIHLGKQFNIAKSGRLTCSHDLQTHHFSEFVQWKTVCLHLHKYMLISENLYFGLS